MASDDLFLRSLRSAIQTRFDTETEAKFDSKTETEIAMISDKPSRLNDSPADKVSFRISEDETEWVAPQWCDFSNCYKEGRIASRFSGADLRGADFNDARLALGDFSGTDARRAQMSGAELTFCDFSGADLRETDLSRSCLCLADLSRADLRSANLTGADLMKALLSGADLRGARLAGACLTHAELEGARFDDSTELPFSFEQAVGFGMIYLSRGKVSQ